MDNVIPMTKDQVQHQLTPDSLKPITGKEELLVWAQIEMTRELKIPIKSMENVRGMIVPREEKYAMQIVDKKMCLTWSKWPIPESYVDKAMEDMVRGLKAQMLKAGLMR
jgi:hypothetical protein